MSGMTEEQKKRGEAYNAFSDWRNAFEEVFEREVTVKDRLLKSISSTISDMLFEHSDYLKSKFDFVEYSEADRKNLFDTCKIAKAAYVNALIERQRKDLEILNRLEGCIDELARAYGV